MRGSTYQSMSAMKESADPGVSVEYHLAVLAYNNVRYLFYLFKLSAMMKTVIRLRNFQTSFKITYIFGREINNSTKTDEQNIHIVVHFIDIVQNSGGFRFCCVGGK